MPIYQRIRGESPAWSAQRHDAVWAGRPQPGAVSRAASPRGAPAAFDQLHEAESRSFSYLYELKFLVESYRVPEIEAALGGLLVPDPCAEDGEGYYNHSVYFDSPAYRAHNAAQDRECVTVTPRIRARRSSPGAPPTTLHLELKRRYDRVIAKRRTALDFDLAERLLTGSSAEIGGLTAISSALAEFQYLVQRFELAPSLSVLYHRDAFFAGPGRDVRVTFDRLVQYCPGTTLDAPAEGFSCALPPDQVVVEVKYGEDAPDDLLGRLRHLGLRPQSFSKLDSARGACVLDRHRARSGTQ